MNENEIISQFIIKLTDKFYNDTLQPSAKEVGYVMERIAHTLRVIGLVGLIGDGAVVVENILKEKMEKFLYTSFSKTPKEKRILPDPTIICPVLENVANSFTKENLVQLYSNLLSAAINKDTAEKVHPAFINIISQMTPLDAKLFSRLTNPFFLAICNTYTEKATTIKSLQNIYLDDEYTEVDTTLSVSMNNLERLGLVYIKTNMSTTFASSIHQPTIDRLKKTKYYKDCIRLYDKKYVHVYSNPGYISELGLEFKKICL